MNTPEGPSADIHHLAYRVRRPEDAPSLDRDADILSFPGTDIVSRPGAEIVQPQRAIEAGDSPNPDGFDTAG